MDMRDISAMAAPETAAQVDRVARRPTPGGALGGLLGLPIQLAQSVAAPALSVVDQGLGALRSVGSDYPNIGNAIGALESGVMAAQGDPYYRERQGLMRAQAQAFGASQAASNDFNAAMQAIYAANPGFDPMNPADFDSALSTIMQMAGPEAGMAFASQFDPTERAAKKAEQYRKLRQDFVKEQGEMADVRDAYDSLISVGNTFVGPTALMTMFAKLIDPGSVVRGEEMQVIKESGGPVNQLLQMVADLKPGAPLSPELRASIRREAARLYNAKARNALGRRRGFERYARQAGIDERGIKEATAGFNAFAPVARGQSRDLDRFAFRGRAPDVPLPPGVIDGEWMWDKQRDSWALIHSDSSRPYGIRIREWVEE